EWVLSPTIVCSALYHLTQEGWRDVVLLERDELTSGTTWHSAAQQHNIAPPFLSEMIEGRASRDAAPNHHCARCSYHCPTLSVVVWLTGFHETSVPTVSARV
ncbi:MAG: FAD-dependent oxidoreductase, partial [Pseudomonadota bacterium]